MHARDARADDAVVVSTSNGTVASAERRAGIPPVVSALDLILLTLYARRAQDPWDIRGCFGSPDARNLSATVEAELPTLPQAMGAAWAKVRR